MEYVKRHTINYPTRGSKINIIHSTLNEHRHHSVAAPHTGLLSFFRAIRYHNVVLRGLNDEEDQTMKLNDAMQHFSKLYGRRNRIFLPSLRDRIDFLNLAIGDLQDAVRKGVNEQLLGVALARVISRIFCIAEHFQELDIAWAMARKYGPDFCIYCRKEACACLERRNNVNHWNVQKHLGSRGACRTGVIISRELTVHATKKKGLKMLSTASLKRYANFSLFL